MPLVYAVAMQAVVERERISVEDYLAGETASQLRHEYVGGDIYAMAGSSVEHNQIAGNIYAACLQRLRAGPCRAVFADIKLFLSLLGEDIFYYPDVMVSCDSRDTDRLYFRFPRIIFEVSSQSTERIDRHEKRAAYQNIETLQEYVIVSQERTEVTIFRRSTNWATELHAGPEQIATFESIGLRLPLSQIYEGVSLA